MKLRHSDTMGASPAVRDGKTLEGIIKRREIAPLQAKARNILQHYENATGCTTAVLDQSGHSVEALETQEFFCRICKKYACSGKSWKSDEYPCTQMHIDGINKARHTMGSYIYMCRLGFSYWISPFLANGCSAGSFIAGRVLGIERQKVIERIQSISGGEISEAQAREYLKDIPEKSPEDIKAMAQILLVCAVQIEKSSGDYAESIRKQFEQQVKPLDQIKFIKARRVQAFSDSGYSLDKERALLAALRRGDHERGKRILEELMRDIRYANPDNFAAIQLRVMELVVLLSRSALGTGNSKNAAMLEANDQYFRRIREAGSFEELMETLNTIIKRMAVPIFSFQGMRHASALRKAERFIWENFTRKISLREIAAASGLSGSYFSTVFKEEMGENLSGYLNRLRMEKAVALLTETEIPLNEIAAICGFEDQSWFSKIFKKHTGLTPGKYREEGGIVTERDGEAAKRQNTGDTDRDTPDGCVLTERQYG
jgi:AraC-like DNA-binding protein/ligand-binding sensor protein